MSFRAIKTLGLPMSNPIRYPKIFFLGCLGGFTTVFGFGVVQPFSPLYASADLMVVAALMMLFLRNMEIREQSEKPNPERKKSQRG
jgi:hypothetical protein